jgi:ATP-dependent DNA helicase RecQ
VGSPPSPVSYYQQVGRAGRGIDHAVVALLPSDADAGVWDYFATATIPVPDQVNRLLRGLEAYGADQPATVPALEAETGLRRGRVELMLKQLAVDGAVERVERGWVRTSADWTFDAEHYDGIVSVRRREADIMRAYTRGERCLMQLLQESLDDPTAEPCGRCSVCLGLLPDPLSAKPDPETVQSIIRLLRGETHVLEPRKMWPGGAFGAKGRIPPALMAEPGRTIVYADAPEWREVIRSTFSQDVGGEPAALDALKAGCVAALSRWRDAWSRRPEVVVDLPAAGYSRLTTEIADHLAEIGRLERAELTVDPSGFADDLSSAEEAKVWRDGVSIEPATAQAIADRSVLLVVDASSSQWPITVAAAKLREAGAYAVLPLLIHRRP